MSRLRRLLHARRWAAYRRGYTEGHADATTEHHADLDAAMHTIWLHGNWRWLTGHMTTGQREAAAAAVLRHDTASSDPTRKAPLTEADLVWWRR